MVKTSYLTVETDGNTDIIDITADCRRAVLSSGFQCGLLIVFNPGSTGGITTIEYEPNLVKDVKRSLEIIAPSNKTYEHAKTWHDDNGSSHVRSFYIKPSLSIPFVDQGRSFSGCDCFGLVQLFYKYMYGVHLREYNISCAALSGKRSGCFAF